ncbi:MAG: NAD-dependent epimerase/dehydratase family protein [Planctomycetia bacterium]|nr:NAD-dependent epimerase/dehydratase family protein [Planctomycetia bacterium]MCC7314075.1 NAD-dependent epimerase/dehydratase family protein [Planctomycetota bacterium]OQY95856.1 MAG: hypothetical protein B6D36_19930 [Planctomycetes bacterium UTPLA1]
MSPAPRPLGRLLLTGVPGWLTTALLDSLRDDPPAGLTAVRCMVLPHDLTRASAQPGQLPVPVEYVAADLRDEKALIEATKGVDTIFHAAGILHVRRTRDWYEINTEGTRRLLNGAISGGAGRFVNISSNAAAGRSDSRDRLMVESDPPKPLSHYGRSKWHAERLLNDAGGRIEVVHLRPCMFYGPPVPQRHVEIYKRIIHGKMPLVGSGDYARSLSHIDNLIQGCRLALTHPAAKGQTYYIADRRTYTTKIVTDAMAAACGVEPRYLRLPAMVGPIAFAGDIVLASMQLYWQTLHLVGESHWHVGVSCEKAMRELGYDPKVEIEAGMKGAVDWCRWMGLLT